MKKLMMALALCLMSAIAMNAQNRQLSTQLPASVPSIDLVVDQGSFTLKPQVLTVSEKDASHTKVEVKFNKLDKASVTLPISYDTALELAYKAAELARDFHLISEKEWQDCVAIYNRQKGK